MKTIKLNILGLLMLICAINANAQMDQIQSANSYLRNKQIDLAKKAIDAAANNESTKNIPKMWYYRARTYFEILKSKDPSVKALDADAPEKAFLSVINCLKTDKDKVFYDEMKPLLRSVSFYVLNKSLQLQSNNDYNHSMEVLKLLYDAIPFDTDDALKHDDISTDKLNMQMYNLASKAKNNDLAKQYLQKLIDVKYKVPSIYIDMEVLCLNDKDTLKALNYVEIGRGLFEDNSELIDDETALYVNLHRQDELLEKIKNEINSDPTISNLYYSEGYLYQVKNDLVNAETAYKKAIELKPDYVEANHKLGALYLNKGIEYSNQASALPPNENKKFDELNKKALDELVLAIPYLEKVHELNPKDLKVSKNLLVLYARTSNNDKYLKLKDELSKAGNIAPTKPEGSSTK